MPLELDKKSIIRKLIVYERGKQLVAKISPEGVYLKRDKSRWKNALFIPWMACFSVAAKMRAMEIKKQRTEQRKLKRGF